MDSLHGWACGFQSGIYGTNDGGKTWAQQACSRAEENIWALGVRSLGRAYAVSKDGLLEYTAQPDTARLCGTSSVHSIAEPLQNVSIRPNPTDGRLFVDLGQWQGQQVQLRVLNAQGQLVLERDYAGESGEFGVYLPEGLASGLYYLVVNSDASGASGQRPAQAAVRFVLER